MGVQQNLPFEKIRTVSDICIALIKYKFPRYKQTISIVVNS